MRYFLTLILICLAMSLFSQEKELETVSKVNIERYAGKWYEIASFPQRFQKGCSCTTAEYGLNEDGSVSVTNRCLKEGKEKVATAKAKVVDKSTNAKLSVRFFWPFTGKYWIIDLADDYSYAVVGHPNREYLWILSRSPQMDGDVYDKIVARARDKGFDISKLNKTVQACN